MPGALASYTDFCCEPLRPVLLDFLQFWLSIFCKIFYIPSCVNHPCCKQVRFRFLIHDSQVNCPLLNHIFYYETSSGISMLNHVWTAYRFSRIFFCLMCVSVTAIVSRFLIPIWFKQWTCKWMKMCFHLFKEQWRDNGWWED